MRTAIIIHGYNDKSEFLDLSQPSASNDHWIPWIQKQLLVNGVETQTPEMPGFYEPRYESWKQMFERLQPDKETMLVGHSLGGGFLVRWLSEQSHQVGQVILVAPWLDPEKMIDPDFFSFNIDPSLSSKTAGLTVMYSTDDDPQILKSVDILKSTLKNATFQEYTDKGHFVLKSLKTEKFPELLDLLLDK